MTMEDNLFRRLHAWASGQDENFVTESFAYLVRHLLRHDAESGRKLLARLTGNSLQVGEADAQRVSITAQVTVEGKRPDIEVTAPGWLVYVEVKVEAPLAPGQVPNYLKRLAMDDAQNKALVLLTRYEPWVSMVQGSIPIVKIRWYQVANWLEEELKMGSVREASSIFLMEQFYGFLRGRGMTIGHVDSHLERGAPALVSLIAMLRQALVEHGLTVRDNMRWPEWVGYEVGPVGLVAYYVGVYIREPTVLKLRTWWLEIDPEKADALNKGRMWKQSGRVRWEYAKDLAAEGSGFYELSTDGQMKVLNDFVASCIALVKQITIADVATEIVPIEGEQDGD